MLIVGVVLVMVALASAAILVGQNHHSTVSVHAAGHTWHWPSYWLVLAGLLIALIAWLGATLIRTGIMSARRARREMAKLRIEHGPYGSHLLPDPDASPFLADTGTSMPIVNAQPVKRDRPRRGHHAA